MKIKWLRFTAKKISRWVLVKVRSCRSCVNDWEEPAKLLELCYVAASCDVTHLWSALWYRSMVSYSAADGWQ